MTSRFLLPVKTLRAAGNNEKRSGFLSVEFVERLKGKCSKMFLHKNDINYRLGAEVSANGFLTFFCRKTQNLVGTFDRKLISNF